MPTDFRDGKTFPRRGRERIGEALWLLRVADKGRAAAAGTIHDYVYPCPMDRGVMERWGVTPDEFGSALARYPNDEELHAWLTGRVRIEGIRAANDWLTNEKAENLDRQDAEEACAEFIRPDGKTAPGYLAPAALADAPGIVLFEEWWGLDDRIKETANRLASHGFSVLVPDLFRGRSAATGDEANHLAQGLDFADAATQDGAGAARYLRERGARKVGAMGFCMGGALAMLAVMHGGAFHAASIWYGYPPPEAGDPSTIAVPLQGHWAAADDFFTAAGVDAIEATLQAAGVAHEFHRYDAKHGFYNSGRAGSGGLGHHHPEHAETAWKRTIEFFDRTLK